MNDNNDGTLREGREQHLRRQLVVGASGTLGLFFLFLGLLDQAHGTPANTPALFVTGTLLCGLAVAVSVGRVDVGLGSHLVFGLLTVLGLGLLVASGGRLMGVYIALPVTTMLAMLIEPRRWGLAWMALALLAIGLGYWLLRSGMPPVIQPNASWVFWAPYRMPFVLSVLALIVGRYYVGQILELRQEALDAAERWQRVSALAIEQEQRFQDFAGQAADWFWETDSEHKLRYVSSGFEACMGLSSRQVIGLRPDEVYHQLAGIDVDARQHMATLEERQAFRNQRLIWMKEDCSLVVMTNQGRPIFDAKGDFQGYRGVVHDITEEETLRRRLKHEGETDELTGLANRRAFMDQSDSLLREARGEHGAALLFIDLDHFKPVNDEGGHAAGDEMLRQVAHAIRSMVPPSSLVARMGGDEFCVLMGEIDLAAAQDYAESVLAAIRSVRVSAAGRTFTVGASIGVACETPVATARTSEWLTAADEAAYQAKCVGRSRVCLSQWGGA